MTNTDGGYCAKCDTVWSAPGVCNCNTQDRYLSVFEREVWNKAIESVLKLDRVDEYAAVAIRKLKK